MQAVLPIVPDDQMLMLIKQAEDEMNEYIRPFDIKRMHYYLTQVSITIVS